MEDIFDFKAQLQSDASRANIDYVSYIIGNDQNAFNLAFEIIFTAPHPINQRAAGVIETVTRSSPAFIIPHVDRMINSFTEFKVDGVKRNFMKIFTRTDFNEEQMGLLTDICFDCIMNNKESIAVRVFAMETLYNISNTYPDIKKELILVIEEVMQLGIPAFIARGRGILKKLFKEIE